MLLLGTGAPLASSHSPRSHPGSLPGVSGYGLAGPAYEAFSVNSRDPGEVSIEHSGC